MNKWKLFFVNTVILVITSLSMQIIGMFFNIYIANKIGSEAIGLFHLVMSIYIFFITIATSGIHLTTTKIVSEQIATCSTDTIAKAVKQCLFFSLLFGLLSGVLLFFLAPSLVSSVLHNRISTKPLYVICFTLPFISMASCISGYFTALRKIAKTASARFFEQIVKITATIYFVNLFLPSGLEYACLSLVIGDCISEVCSFVYSFLLYLWDKRQYKTSKTEVSFQKKIFKTSLPIAITSYIRSRFIQY